MNKRHIKGRMEVIGNMLGDKDLELKGNNQTNRR